MSTRSLILLTTATLLLLVAAAAAAEAARAEPRPLAGGWSPIRNVSDPHIQELGGWAVTEHARRANDGLRFGERAEPRPLAGGWSPIRNVSDPHIQELGGWAVTEHARRANDGLRFGEVTSGEQQVVSGMNYRLVLDATDADGKIAAYGALVYEQSWTNTRELISFTSAN